MEQKEWTLIYENPLADLPNVKNFILEGEAALRFDGGCMRMENALDGGLGQRANYVLWCPEDFPENIRVEWEFKPLTERGLCILFFAASGKKGEDLFDDSLLKRTGEYPQYHSGDINAFHISYYRRKEADERAFHTCNLRKSYGFYLAAQGADPIPDAADAVDFYRLTVVKDEDTVTFSVNGLCVLCYKDDGISQGAPLKGGKIGFRQLAPLSALYRNLNVYRL